MNPAALKAVCDTGFAKILMMLAWEQGAEPRKLVGAWALQLRKASPLLLPCWRRCPTTTLSSPVPWSILRSPDEVIPAFFRGDRKQRGSAERRQPEIVRRRVSKAMPRC